MNIIKQLKLSRILKQRLFIHIRALKTDPSLVVFTSDVNNSIHKKSTFYITWWINIKPSPKPSNTLTLYQENHGLRTRISS